MLDPLISHRSRPDPLTVELEAARIGTLEVRRHFVSEGKAMDLRDRLREVRCPTLVLNGAHDPLVPPQLGREIVDAIPHALARSEVIEEAAHEVFADNPIASYQLLREFLRRSA